MKIRFFQKYACSTSSIDSLKLYQLYTLIHSADRMLPTQLDLNRTLDDNPFPVRRLK